MCSVQQAGKHSEYNRLVVAEGWRHGKEYRKVTSLDKITWNAGNVLKLYWYLKLW